MLVGAIDGVAAGFHFPVPESIKRAFAKKINVSLAVRNTMATVQ
jgi:hypothetical protein